MILVDFLHATRCYIGNNYLTVLKLCLYLHSDATAFQSFVRAIRAVSGGDAAEDIMGGLNAVFHRLNWRSEANKVLYQISSFFCCKIGMYDQTTTS